jgi:hypothetical protein
MYNDYLLEKYAKQQHAELMQESKNARLANEALSPRKVSMNKSESPLRTGWWVIIRNFLSLFTKTTEQAFPPSTKGAARIRHEA